MVRSLSLLKYLSRVLRKIRFNICLLEGEERISNKPVSILVVEAEGGREKAYLAKLVFSGDFKETAAGKVWFWGMHRILRQQLADIVFITGSGPDLYRYYSEDDYFYIPNWLRGEIVFSDAQARMKTSGHLKSDLRRIRKNELDFEVTRTPSRFDDFYHNMYLPHISRQFGQTALLMTYERMKELEGRSELMLITRQGDTLAGQIMVYENDRVRCWSIGVRDGNHDYVKMGAQAALYWYEIQYLTARGYQAMHVGASRAFLRDGVLRFKNKWGMRMLKGSQKGIMLKPMRKSAGAVSFLVNNPFIHQVHGEFQGIVFADSGPEVTDYRGIEAQYRLSGLAKLRIYTDIDKGHDRNSNIPDGLQEKVTIASIDSLF